MANFSTKIPKSESPDKTPYTVYYPHKLDHTHRSWKDPWYQVMSIDPARKNYAIRIEKRFFNGKVETLVFDKIAIAQTDVKDKVIMCNTYQNLTYFLSKYHQYILGCHFIIIERQLPQNYQATRISQHSISYFCLTLADTPLLPAIIEVDPKLKGRILGAPKNISDKQLKSWSIEVARRILTERNDIYGLGVLDFFSKKQDDLADTLCQSEALFTLWGLNKINISNHNDIFNISDDIKPNNSNIISLMNQNKPSLNIVNTNSNNKITLNIINK